MSHVRTIASITDELAREILDAAVLKARDDGQRSAIAIMDATGHLAAFIRMDGAPVQAGQIAQDKAYTAAGFGMPTGQWHEFMSQDAPLALGAPAIDRLIPFGGGLPIIVNDQVIGGLGVSGGHWSQDTQIAEHALATALQPPTAA